MNLTYQTFVRNAINCLLLSLVGTLCLVEAKTPDMTSNKAFADIIISPNKGSELQLEVRQMPLSRVLDAIANKAKVNIHYSVLPEGLVTATCVGASLKQILECLFDKKADIIVRNSHDLAKTSNKLMGTEAWILGTKLSSSASPASCVALSQTENSLSSSQNEGINDQNDNIDIAEMDEILKRAESKNALDRVEAIGELLAAGYIGDPSIKAALDKALVDKDADVRAQAISSLSHREGNSADGAIQDALQDTSADVRLRAVDGITNNIPMLQQALNDSDEDVRSLASAKLELLTAGNANKQ